MAKRHEEKKKEWAKGKGEQILFGLILLLAFFFAYAVSHFTVMKFFGPLSQ